MGQTLLGKWHLDALLGCGGMAVVYAATHRNGMRGAVKMLHKSRSCDVEMRRRFRREGYFANKVDHPAAVRVLDDDVTLDGQAFLVMELLEGTELNDLANRNGGRLPVDRMLSVVDQLLDGLAAAHDKGLVHRDIKPENVFLTHDGRVKILDFGIAHVDGEHSAHRATQTGTPMGTPAFMAPEQARGRWDLVGPQSDLWSVGAMMFTLMSGHFVHEEETVAELLAATFTKRARSLADVLPGAPLQVVAIVDRALELHLADRWEDARAMQRAVREAYRSICGESMPPPPSDDFRGPSPSSPVSRPFAEQPTARAPVTGAVPRTGMNRRREVAALLCLVGAVALATVASFDNRRAAFAAGGAAPITSSRGVEAPMAAATMLSLDSTVAAGSVLAASPRDELVAPRRPESAAVALPARDVAPLPRAERPAAAVIDTGVVAKPAPTRDAAPAVVATTALRPARRDLKALFDRRH